MENPIKRILVPLDPSVYADAAASSACAIAAKRGAEVTGVAVLDSSEIRSSLVPAIGPYYPMMIDAVQEKVNHADKILEDCMKRFAETCSAAGVTHRETEYEGVPTQKLLESSIFFDLVVVGMETFFHFETRHERGDNLADILDRTVVPVLAVPATGISEIKSVVIAFDGSLGSARAMQDFARFAVGGGSCEVTVLVAEHEADKAKFLLENAESYLRAHGIKKVMTVAAEGPVEEVVDDSYLDAIDLLVAGIHSRKPMKDMFVGSFTKSLIEKKAVSLFLSH